MRRPQSIAEAEALSNNALLSEEAIVLSVSTDPKPYYAMPLHCSERPIAKTDTGGVDRVITFQFLEMQAGVRRIALEETIRALGILLDIGRQISEQFSGSLRCPGFNQRIESNGRV